MVPGVLFLKILARFGFQESKKSNKNFYYSETDLPKKFLRKYVEKQWNAIPIGILIAYPHCVDICGFEILITKNTFVITSRQRAF